MMGAEFAAQYARAREAPPLVVDAAAWTGRAVSRSADAVLRYLAREGARPLSRQEAPNLYAAADYLARRAGIAPPALFHVEALHPFGGAMALPELWCIVITRPALARPPRELAALLAHEVAHLAAGHAAVPLAGLMRPAALVAVGIAAALGHVGLILAAVGALVAQDLAFRRRVAAVEREADELAARYLGTVAPLVAIEIAAGLRSRPMVERIGAWLECYPGRRPWLDRLAAAELVEMHATSAR
jgi:Zn-dependent protease with chaperone function